MRSIISISLPNQMAKDIAKEVKRTGAASTSEFFRGLLRAWKTHRLIADVRASEKEYRQGKYKIMRSPEDLWK